MSPWFRRKRKQTTEQPEAQLVTQQAPALTPASPAESTAATEAATDPTKKRRRGNRGGRGRKKPGAAATAATTDEKPEQKPQPAKRERKPAERSQRQERRANQQGNRRRVPQKRAPLPKAKRELLISVDVGEQRVAILEDDRVAEVYLERPERRSIAGNIYLGTVDNVLPGMEAAFVEIGLEKNGFLYVDEIVVPELEGKRHGKKITDLIARGQQIMVQAVKDPMKTKGARLTTEISLPGRFLVFVPQGEGLGVSRRLDDNERARLKDIIKGLNVKEGGIIVRTAAEGASAEDVERDLVFLQRLWKTIQANAKKAKAPALVYQEAELPLRIVRDLFAGDFESAQIDHERTYKRIVGYLKKTSPHMLERVHRYKEKTPLFEGTGVDAEIRSTLNRRVDLPSGGYLVFDYAEAFTVIDVNTGRFVGSRSKNSTGRLEDTITKNNLEAVKEVVRQLRLRDIVKAIAPKKGGVIVRTAAEGASDEDVERDLVFLQRLWKSIEANAEKAKAPALVYQEAELPLRVTRDLFTGDFEKAVVDDERTHKRIVGYLKKTSPHMVDRVIRYREKTPLFEQTGVEDAIQSTLSRRVDLPSGGYLVFDYAEAFTVIDVNTGRFVGSRSKSSTGRLEDTITANNLEAVKEVVHQLRLRDIGGIIVIDFIDMGSPKNRATVEEALKNELERDRTKTYVVEISPLGLVEMTRQNVTEGPREILTQKCPTCAGDGIVLSTHSAAIDAERRLRALAAGSKRGLEAYRVEMEENVASHVIGPGALRLAEIERLSKRRFFIEGKAGAPLDHFKVVAEGKLVDLAPKAPVEEGAEVRIELVEI
ncbi:MAG TPA: Rne/Rng family ribonuclease, partial [Gaiellaceae bacterium]